MGSTPRPIPEDKIRDQDIIVEERSETLDEAQTGEFRSMTMRLAYLSQDRPDVIHASRTLASAMKSPKMGDWLRLKKVVRYLLKYPYMKRTFWSRGLRRWTCWLGPIRIGPET